MKVVVFAGFSGSGKTTLLEQIIAQLVGEGQRVSVLKHAHHHFDIDQPGKDSWRHRQAGAREVLIASDRRLALMRENPVPAEPDVHELLTHLGVVDWVLVEGFKTAALPKIEIWRQPEPGRGERPVRYPHDAQVLAVATDNAARLPVPPRQPVLDLNDAPGLVRWMREHAAAFEYAAPGIKQGEFA